MTPGRAADEAVPRVTVSLVTYNGLEWLPGCLASIRTQTLAPSEVLVVDNASTDGTVDWLRAQAQSDERLRLYESAENVGFARAHNRNIFQARGDFVCLLNQDVELDERFLEEAVKAFASDPCIAAVQGRLRRLGPGGARSSVLDSTGLVMYRDRRVLSRGQGEPDGPTHASPGPVWGADGPAPVYRRSALLQARLPAARGAWEVLDEDFFMYKEDVDLAWRLRNMGWRAWYAPMALAWHARGTGGSPGRSVAELLKADRTIPRWAKAISWRNHRLMQVKNESVLGYLAAFPWIARRELLSLGFMALVDPRRLLILISFLSALPSAVRKRRFAGKSRRSRSSRSTRMSAVDAGAPSCL